MIIKYLDIIKETSNNDLSDKANLASTIASFGYKKEIVNEIMDFISYIEYKYEKNKTSQ